MKELNTVDLFCGAGGASTGLELALKRLKMNHKGLAINHWAVAVDTMRKNHPDIDTKQMSIEEAVPAELVPGGVVDLLWASPSCTHHSRAKGGKPRSNQLRAQPELVLTWLDQLFVRRINIENVPEFVDWGPLNKDGKPIKKLKGSCFRAWVAAIEARNYTVEWRIVNCADYGDATSRRRFFLKAVRKGCGKIRWPEPTHAENPQPDLFGHELKKWRGVRECLDLTDTGKSIFNREKPLAKNTLRRIMVGLRKYNGMDFQMDWLDAGGKDNCRLRKLDQPLFAQPTWNRTWIVRPFVIRMNKNCDAESVDEPLSTTTTKEHHALCHPVIIDHFKNGEAQSIDEPIGAQTTHDRYSVATPFIMNNNENNVPRPLDKPLVTLTTGNHAYLCTPLVLGQHGGAQARPIEEPCPTIATSGAVRMITPLVIDMSHPGDKNDERRVTGGNEPMQTITTRNNSAMVALPVLEDGRVIDIRLRMLKPSELAAAHSFPKDYVLTGNRGEQVKQIGNSVPVMTAAAMCEADFREVS